MRCLAWRLTLESQRSTGELASYQQKMFRIDDHVGIAIAGLTSDARVLRYSSYNVMNLGKLITSRCSNFMRQQAMSSKMVFNRPVPVNRLVSAIADSLSFMLAYPSYGLIHICTRGSSKYSRVWPSSVWCRVPCHWAGRIRTASLRVLPVRELV